MSVRTGEATITQYGKEKKRKDKVTLFSDHKGTLLRQQPRAVTNDGLWSLSLHRA